MSYIDIYETTESQASTEACAVPINGTNGVGISDITQTDDTHFTITLTNGVQYVMTIPVSTITGGLPDPVPYSQTDLEQDTDSGWYLQLALHIRVLFVLYNNRSLSVKYEDDTGRLYGFPDNSTATIKVTSV